MSTTTMGPLHVERLNSLAKLENEGFEGPDNLETSLFDYGIIWRHDPETKEYLFVYGIEQSSDGSFVRFDRCGFSDTLDFYKEFGWIKGEDWQRFFDFLGLLRQDWENSEFCQKIHDLFQYWGSEEIFGSQNWEGFAILNTNVTE